MVEAYKVVCNDCGHQWLTNISNPRCPKKNCGSDNVTIIDPEKLMSILSNKGNTGIKEIPKIIGDGPKSIPIDEETMMKLEYISEVTKIKTEEIVRELVDKMYLKIRPLIVPRGTISNTNGIYEIDVDGMENIYFRKIPITFSNLYSAIVVAQNFNREGSIAVISEERGKWVVFYEVPDTSDIFNVRIIKDLRGKAVVLR